MSKHSATVDEFYATSPETAQWLLSELRSRYDLAGKTALEPCVGGWVFPDAAPELQWVTNDLNLWTKREPNYNCNFLETEFTRTDFVITNPPFGPNNKLAFAFLEKAATLAEVIAMIVPSSMGPLTPRVHKILPPDFKLILSERCPNQFFDLPDGSKRPVRTHGIIWERVPSYKRPAPKKPPQDLRSTYLQFCDDGEYAIRIYGDGIGDIQPWTEDCKGTWARFNFPHGKKCIGYKLILSYPWRTHYGSSGHGRAPWDNSPGVIPRINTTQITHWVNCMAVLEGRLAPEANVDYEAFYSECSEQYLTGLTPPSYND